jgi:hypothetical protein
VITISCDEKPGVQALAPKSPDLPPVPGQYPSHTRDYEYERLGTVSLLAGLDLHTGQVTEIVRDSHKSRDFIAFLQKLDAIYPTGTPIRLLLDNHSAHISRETQAHLQTVPGRFRFSVHPHAWFLAQLGRDLVQQDGAEYAAGHPGSHERRIGSAHPSVL